MNVKVTGELIEIFDAEITKNFEKRRFWLQTEGQYPQVLEIQAWQGDSNLLDHYPIGARVTVSIDLRGNKFRRKDGTDSVFNTLKMFKIELA